MSFKENLLKKIKIDLMSKKVIGSIGPPADGRKVDKQTMRSLLEMSPYKFRRKRDLDIYVREVETDKEKILVLDNDLAIYNTTSDDVALRKSPTVKEMLSIRNVIRILNDTDVVVSKKEKSVKTIQKECIDILDLSFEKSDLDAIEKDGTAALEKGYTDGVIECLSLFAELLGYFPPPKTMKISNHKIVGALIKKDSGELLFGPIVIYSLIYNVLKLIDEQIDSLNKEKTEYMYKVAMGKEKASKEGSFVFQYLKDKVLQRRI